MAQEYNKRIYTVGEFYTIIRYALKSIKTMKKGRKSGDLDKPFESRIMLAVTEVNGCEICSYHHTSEALKNGMSQEDISSLLNGDSNNIPTEESVAIFFAQHYAETKGKPKRSSWKRVVDTYGKEKAKAILAATRVIMFGNVHGIAFGALKNRVQCKALAKSSLGYELAIVFGVILYIPAALIHNLIPKK